MQKIVAVPGAARFIEGVVNLRGAIIPVVDLRHRFGLSLPANGQKSVIVITELDKLKIGLVVDKVTEVVKMPEEAIEPPSSLLTGGNVDNAYLRGIGKSKRVGKDEEESLVILLDLNRVFSLDEQEVLGLAA